MTNARWFYFIKSYYFLLKPVIQQVKVQQLSSYSICRFENGTLDQARKNRFSLLFFGSLPGGPWHGILIAHSLSNANRAFAVLKSQVQQLCRFGFLNIAMLQKPAGFYTFCSNLRSTKTLVFCIKSVFTTSRTFLGFTISQSPNSSGHTNESEAFYLWQRSLFQLRTWPKAIQSVYLITVPSKTKLNGFKSAFCC